MASKFAVLETAIKEQQRDEIWSYLDAGGDPNLADDSGYTLLMNAIRYAAMNTRRPAAREAGLEIVDRLLRSGADPNRGNAYYDRTALHYAVSETPPEFTQRLVEAKADVTRRTRDGHTPLMMSALCAFRSERDAERTVDVLVEAGADVHSTVDDGWTALHSAAAEGQVGNVKALLRHGAEPNAATAAHVVPLHLAAAGGFEAVAHVLVDAGADVAARSTATFLIGDTGYPAGHTPRDVALRCGHDALATLLQAAALR